MNKNSLQEFINSCRCGMDSEDFLSDINSSIENITKSPEYQQKLQIYKTLGNETRYLIYNLVKKERLCTCSLADILHLSQGTISHHIKKLISAGLIVAQKEGYFSVFHIVDDSF